MIKVGNIGIIQGNIGIAMEIKWKLLFRVIWGYIGTMDRTWKLLIVQAVMSMEVPGLSTGWSGSQKLFLERPSTGQGVEFRPRTSWKQLGLGQRHFDDHQGVPKP